MRRHQVDQHRVQQLLRYGVALTNDGAHQVHHVHVHLLVVAVAGETRRANKSVVTGLQSGSSYAGENGSANEEVCTRLLSIEMNNFSIRGKSSMKVYC